jgi:CHASE3 domain sensor protein
VFLALIVSGVVLVAAGVAAHRSVLVLADASARLVESKETSLAQQTLWSLRDAETGQRGYLLSDRAS